MNSTTLSPHAAPERSPSLTDTMERHPLGPSEDILWRASRRFRGDGSGLVTLRIHGRIQPELLRGALAVVQKRHPRLRARIAPGPDGKMCFEVHPSFAPIPLQFKSFDTEELPWSDEAHRVLEEEFSDGEPMCRLAVLQSELRPVSELILVMHHSLTDGIAALCLLHQILSHYETLWGGTRLEDLLAATEPLPFLASDNPPLTASWKDRWAMFRRLAKSYARRRRANWTPIPSDSSEYTPYLTRTQLSVEDTHKLLRRCRQQRVPGYGMLFAAALTSLAETFHGQPVQFACRSPINMRELPNCKRVISYEHLGCFAGGLDRVYHFSGRPVEFWSLAREASEDMREFILRQGPAMMMKLIWVADALAPLFRVSAERPPMRDTIQVNYIPDLGIKDRYGDLSMEAFAISGRWRYLGVSLLAFASVLSGRMNFSLGSVNVARQFREEYHQRFMEKIHRVVQGEI